MDRKGAEMKIYNKITKQFVKSDKLRKLDDCFIIEYTERYEKTIRYFFKPQWEEAEGAEELLKNVMRCLNNVTANNVLDIETIGKEHDTIIQLKIELEETSKRSGLIYNKLTNVISIDNWYLKDNDLEVALKKYLEYQRSWKNEY
jgi:hypothetical protein